MREVTGLTSVLIQEEEREEEEEEEGEATQALAQEAALITQGRREEDQAVLKILEEGERRTQREEEEERDQDTLLLQALSLEGDHKNPKGPGTAKRVRKVTLGPERETPGAKVRLLPKTVLRVMKERRRGVLVEVGVGAGGVREMRREVGVRGVLALEKGKMNNL